MSKVYTDPQNYTNIAEAIRDMNGTEETYKPAEMPAAIRAIAPVVQALTVTQNGTYTAPSGVDGYSPVTVNVSGGGGGWQQVCDMVPHGGYYTSGMNLYTDTDPVYSFVVPITAGKVYLIRVVTPGNRFRITTWNVDPTTITSGIGIRSLDDQNNPPSGYELLLKANSDETYLNVYYTNQGDTGVVINAYEAANPS